MIWRNSTIFIIFLSFCKMAPTDFQKALIAIIVVAVVVIVIIYIVNNNNSGLECKGDDDCSGSTVCSNGKCVQCAFDSDCPGLGTCQNNKCVAAEPAPGCEGCELTESATVFESDMVNDPISYFWDGDVQSTGKIIAGGGDITRYNMDGTRDTTFGTSGWVDLGTLFTGIYAHNAVNVSVDDSIYIAAAGTVGGNVSHIAKLLPDGAPDTSFGVSGLASVPVADMNTNINNFAFDADGNIYGMSGSSGKLCKFLADGTVDATFGTNGVVQVEWNSSTTTLRNANILHYNAGLYIICRADSPPVQIGVVKYNLDGTKDATYGTSGDAIFDVSLWNTSCVDPSFWFYGGCGIDSQGNFYLGGGGIAYDNGTTCDNDFPYTVIKFLPDGTVDTSYGDRGVFVDTLAPFYTDGLFSESYSQMVFTPCDNTLITSVITYPTTGDYDSSYNVQITAGGVAIQNSSYSDFSQDGYTYYWNSFPHPDGYLVAIGEVEDVQAQDAQTLVRLFSCPDINYRKATRPW